MLRRGVTWRARKTAPHLWPHHMRCVISPMWMMNACAWMLERMMSFWRNCRRLSISCKVPSRVISWNSTGSHFKQGVCCTWLDEGRSMRGKQLKDLLSNVRRQDPVLRNMCVARLVGSSATLCRATDTSDHWSMVLVVWNVSYKRALLLQMESTKRSPRNSCKYFDCKTKAQLFSSLVLSVLLYGCETWPEPTQSQGKRLEAFQMRCLRRLAGEPRVLIPGHVRISDVELRQLKNSFY